MLCFFSGQILLSNFPSVSPVQYHLLINIYKIRSIALLFVQFLKTDMGQALHYAVYICKYICRNSVSAPYSSHIIPAHNRGTVNFNQSSQTPESHPEERPPSQSARLHRSVPSPVPAILLRQADTHPAPAADILSPEPQGDSPRRGTRR